MGVGPPGAVVLHNPVFAQPSFKFCSFLFFGDQFLVGFHIAPAIPVPRACGPPAGTFPFNRVGSAVAVLCPFRPDNVTSLAVR